MRRPVGRGDRARRREKMRMPVNCVWMHWCCQELNRLPDDSRVNRWVRIGPDGRGVHRACRREKMRMPMNCAWRPWFCPEMSCFLVDSLVSLWEGRGIESTPLREGLAIVLPLRTVFIS